MTEHYEAPKAIRLDDTERAYGACEPGSTPVLEEACYRGNGFAGDCVTGKSASGGCHAGM